MMNFWLIWLLFVPIGIFFFGRTPAAVYQNHILLKGILDFLGLAFSFGYYGYNPTWWFMSCIIILYLFFPLIFRYKRLWPFIFVFSVAMTWMPLYVLNPIRYYLVAFICGIICSQNKQFIRIISNDNLINKIVVILIGILMFAIRNFVPVPLLFDTVLTISIVVAYKLFAKNGWFVHTLMFLGKHSMNIFLFHTFIYYYYCHDLVYWTRNPILIFVTLLGFCIVISVFIEKIKSYIRFDTVCKKVVKCLN